MTDTVALNLTVGINNPPLTWDEGLQTTATLPIDVPVFHTSDQGLYTLRPRLLDPSITPKYCTACMEPGGSLVNCNSCSRRTHVDCCNVDDKGIYTCDRCMPASDASVENLIDFSKKPGNVDPPPLECNLESQTLLDTQASSLADADSKLEDSSENLSAILKISPDHDHRNSLKLFTPTLLWRNDPQASTPNLADCN